MYTLIRSQTFLDWLKALRDENAKTRITFRLQQATQGNLGDSKPVGEGVSEMRINAGAGYRVYYTRTDKTVIFLLMGGNKSTQESDIKRQKNGAGIEDGEKAMPAKLKSESYAPLDIAELLETDQQIVDFLQMLLAEGSPKEIAAGLGTVARSRGMTNVAREAGVSRESLYRALSGEGNPEFATILNVIRALNLQLTVVPSA